MTCSAGSALQALAGLALLLPRPCTAVAYTKYWTGAVEDGRGGIEPVEGRSWYSSWVYVETYGATCSKMAWGVEPRVPTLDECQEAVTALYGRYTAVTVLEGGPKGCRLECQDWTRAPDTCTPVWSDRSYEAWSKASGWEFLSPHLLVICKACSAGYVRQRGGPDECVRCPISASIGSKECDMCPPGRYGYSLSWDDRCEDCLSGRYSDEFGLASCKSCADGVMPADKTACEPCPAGTKPDVFHEVCVDDPLQTANAPGPVERGSSGSSSSYSDDGLKNTVLYASLAVSGAFFLIVVGRLVAKYINVEDVSSVVAEIAGPAAAAPEEARSVRPVVEVEHGNTMGLTHTEIESLPGYWTNARCAVSEGFDQMLYVSRSRHQRFQDMLTHTYHPRATRDRRCPRRQHGPTPGGCPCVQPGGSPGLPSSYQVLRVVRVEDSEMWGRYVGRREAIRRRRLQGGDAPAALDPPALTAAGVAANPDTFEPLDDRINEVYLWHGTRVRTALAIAQNDFDIQKAGNNLGTMYGSGAYFAESSTKADEYADDEAGGYYQGVFALLLCRTVLGRFLYTLDRDEGASQKVDQGLYDSVVGDRLTAVGTFREFVVCDRNQTYPEYVVLYSRRDANGEDMSRAQLHKNDHFHLELPVYWTNVDKHPRSESFHMQYRAKASTVQLLQGLLDAELKSTKLRVRIQAARRVEHSEMWNHYVDFKKKLWRDLPPGAKKYKSVQEEGAGEVITHVHLNASSDEAFLSADNFDESLNEYLLWHGTTKWRAEQIVQTDFHIPKDDGEIKHGQRFGAGAYFADSAAKSLRYAGSDDVRYLILCRVLCGDMYYSVQEHEGSASRTAAAGGKHSVLAQPLGFKPREFIIWSNAQVYPEYILECKVEDQGQHDPDTLII